MNDDITKLLAIMARLRDPDGGCPWDIEQTFATIAPYTIEEAYEVADAIERSDMAALKDELGDLLLQVVYHAQMAAEAGAFAFADVVAAINAKMTARHPHVFGDAEVADAAEQSHAWEVQKAAERAEGGNSSALDGVARGLPALLRAAKLQQRAARVGYDWPDAAGAVAKLAEEISELQREIGSAAGNDKSKNQSAIELELADVLFSAVNVARKLGLDPEAALRKGNAKFERRFGRVEEFLAADGKRPEDASLAEMETMWERAKAEE